MRLAKKIRLPCCVRIGVVFGMTAAVSHKLQTFLMLLKFFVPIAFLKYRAGRIGIEVLDRN